MRWINYASLFLFLSFNLFSQNETQKWYFGYQCGLDFATNPPTIIPSPVFNSMEGGASIADASGNLLFYTDGVTVWDNTHSVMANGTGLLGHKSSTQSSIIVKQPGSASVYYIFTQYEMGRPDGFRYSVVDMSLAAGMGSVTTKNVLLHTPSCEKLSAVKHCNGTDFWIVTHDYNSDVFRSLLLTSAGLVAPAVLSSVGPVLVNPRYNSVLKISPNGKKIAMPSLTGGALDIFDFNTATGVVSNHFNLSNIWSYGCEFSPDGTKFYAGVDNIYQWDLCAGSTSAIQSSSVTIFLNTTISMAYYQLAPDGKIYISMLQQNALAVINNPNLSGAACNFVSAAQSVGTGTATLGLPNFAVSYFKSSATFSFTQNCSAVTFTAPPPGSSGCGASETFSASSWIFSDPSSGSANTSTLSTITHTFSSAGIYKVKLLLYSSCGVDTVAQNVNIQASSLSVISSETICAGSSGTIQASGADTYSWSSGASTSSLVISPSVTTVYTVTGYFSNGCTSNATTTVIVNSTGTPVVDFVYKSPLCVNDLNPSPELKNGFSLGGIFSSVSSQLALEANSGNIDLATSGPGTFIINYFVPAQNCVTAGNHSATLIIQAAPSLNISADVKIAPGKSTVLEVKGGDSYTWSPAQDISCINCSTPEVSPKESTIYCVMSSEQGCISKNCVSVIVSCEGGNFTLPNAFSPNGDGNNDLFCLRGWDVCVTNFSVLIYNRWGEKVFQSADPDFCWDGKFGGTPAEPDVLIYVISASYADGKKINKKGNITLIR